MTGLLAVTGLALVSLAVVVVVLARKVARGRDETLAELRRDVDVLSTVVDMHGAAMDRQACNIEAFAANVQSQANRYDQRIAALAEQLDGRPASRRRPVVVEVLSADGRRIG
jgi:hypothetical protein